MTNPSRAATQASPSLPPVSSVNASKSLQVTVNRPEQAPGVTSSANLYSNVCLTKVSASWGARSPASHQKWLPPLPLLWPMKPPSLKSVPQVMIPSLCLQHSPRRFCHPPVIPQRFLPRKGLSPPPASSSTSFSPIRYAAPLTLTLRKSPCITHISTAALDKGLPTVITKNHLCKFGSHACQSICKAMSTSFQDTALCIGTLLSSLPKDKTIWT